MWEITLLIVLWLSQATLGYNNWANAGQLPQRMLDLINAYNARGAKQISDVTGIRSMYENTAQFEKGYVMSEILDRYRKMVGLAQRGRNYTMDSLFDTIKNTELIQKLFLEIFHLVNMFHEISRKYGEMHTDGSDPTAHLIVLESERNRTLEIDKIRKREKTERMKKIKKERQDNLKRGKVVHKKNRKPGNKWWPIDYGWEIDYQWW